MLKALITGAALVASIAGTAAPASAAFETLPKDKMGIDVVAANGSGCPLGSADATVSPDNTAFTVTYSQFTAQVGQGAKPLDFRENCQLALVLLHRFTHVSAFVRLARLVHEGFSADSIAARSLASQGEL